VRVPSVAVPGWASALSTASGSAYMVCVVRGGMVQQASWRVVRSPARRSTAKRCSAGAASGTLGTSPTTGASAGTGGSVGEGATAVAVAVGAAPVSVSADSVTGSSTGIPETESHPVASSRPAAASPSTADRPRRRRGAAPAPRSSARRGAVARPGRRDGTGRTRSTSTITFPAVHTGSNRARRACFRGPGGAGHHGSDYASGLVDPVYRTVIGLARTVFFLEGLKFTVTGDENIPATGGAVLAVNHTGYMDFTY